MATPFDNSLLSKKLQYASNPSISEAILANDSCLELSKSFSSLDVLLSSAAEPIVVTRRQVKGDEEFFPRRRSRNVLSKNYEAATSIEMFDEDGAFSRERSNSSPKMSPVLSAILSPGHRLRAGSPTNSSRTSILSITLSNEDLLHGQSTQAQSPFPATSSPRTAHCRNTSGMSPLSLYWRSFSEIPQMAVQPVIFNFDRSVTYPADSFNTGSQLSEPSVAERLLQSSEQDSDVPVNANIDERDRHFSAPDAPPVSLPSQTTPVSMLSQSSEQDSELPSHKKTDECDQQSIALDFPPAAVAFLHQASSPPNPSFGNSCAVPSAPKMSCVQRLPTSRPQSFI